MKIIGMMLADLDGAAIGLPSRAGTDLAGEPVIRRAVRRALAARSLANVAILCPADQRSRLAELLGPVANDARLHIAPRPPTRDEIYGKVDPDRVRLARRWSLSGWRGGVGGACWFDELLAPAAQAKLAAELSADAVALLSPDAPLADAAMIDAIAAQHVELHEQIRMTISQAPPGLGTMCLATPMLGELAATGQTIGRLMAYDPDHRRPDYVASPATYKLPVEQIACPHRFLADTARGVALLETLIGQLGESPTIEQATRAANDWFASRAERYPAELDIELTTRRAMNDTLRPNANALAGALPFGSRLNGRDLADPTMIERLCESIRASAVDDLVVTLGGIGDALLHPDVLTIAARLKQAGALAVAVRTAGTTLTDGQIDALLDSPMDALVVELDAATAEGYRELKGIDAYAPVTASMRRLLTRRNERAAERSGHERVNSERAGPSSAPARGRTDHAGPLLIAEMLKCPATLVEMEAFFDRWHLSDEAHLAGLHDYAGQFNSPAGPGWPTCPPRRRPCVRVSRRLTIQADGTVPQCDMDFLATAPLGRIQDQTLDELWASATVRQLQADHCEQKLDNRPLCQRCDQWNRP